MGSSVSASATPVPEVLTITTETTTEGLPAARALPSDVITFEDVTVTKGVRVSGGLPAHGAFTGKASSL